MSMTSLSPGPLFREVGFNRTSTPVGIRATPEEIKALYERQPFQEDIDWPSESPVANTYDVGNTSAKLVILNNKYTHKKLRGYDNHPRPHSADPDRHTSAVGKNAERHNPCLDSSSPDFEPKPKVQNMWVNQVQRPPWTPLENTFVNPKRHRSCQVSSNPTYQSLEYHKPKKPSGVQRKDPRPSISMKDNSALLHRNMSQSNKRYMNYISKTYDMTNMKQLKQLQYRDLVLRQQYLGFNSDEQYKKYMMYIEGSRKRQFGTKEPLFRSGQRTPRRAQSSLGTSSSPTRVSQSDENVSTSHGSSVSTNIPAPPPRPKSSTPYTRNSRTREPASQNRKESTKKTTHTGVYSGKSKKTITRESLQKHAKGKKENTTPRGTEDIQQKQEQFTSKRSDTSDSSSSFFSSSTDSRSHESQPKQSSVSSTGSLKVDVKEKEEDKLDQSDRFNNNTDTEGTGDDQDALKTSRREKNPENYDSSKSVPATDDAVKTEVIEDSDTKENDKTNNKYEQESLLSTSDSESSNTSTSNCELPNNNGAFNVVTTSAVVHTDARHNSDPASSKDQPSATNERPNILIHRATFGQDPNEEKPEANDLLTAEDDQLETVSVSSEILRSPAIYDKKYQSDEERILSVNDQLQDAVSVNSDILSNPAHYDTSPKDDTRDSHGLRVDTQELDKVSVNSEVLRVPAAYDAKYQANSSHESDLLATSFNNTTTIKEGSFHVEADKDDVQELQQPVDEDQPDRKQGLPEDQKLVFYFKRQNVDDVDMGGSNEEKKEANNEENTNEHISDDEQKGSQTSLKTGHREGVDRPRTRLGRPDTTGHTSDSSNPASDSSSDEETGGLSASFYREGVDRPKSRAGRKKDSGDSSADEAENEATQNTGNQTVEDQGDTTKQVEPKDADGGVEDEREDIRSRSTVDSSSSEDEDSDTESESTEERGDRSAQQVEQSIAHTGEASSRDQEEESIVGMKEESVQEKEESIGNRGELLRTNDLI